MENMQTFYRKNPGPDLNLSTFLLSGDSAKYKTTNSRSWAMRISRWHTTTVTHLSPPGCKSNNILEINSILFISHPLKIPFKCCESWHIQMCPPDGPVAQSKNFADSPVLWNCTGIIKKIASGQDMMILPEDSSIYFPLHPLKFLFAFLQSSRFLIL